MHRCLASLAALTVTVAASRAAAAAVVTLNPGADAFMTPGPANTLAGNNYGGGGALGLSAPGSPNGEFQSVLSFNTTTAKSTFDGLYGAGAWSVQSVTLQLTATPVNNALFNANTAGSFLLGWMQNDGWTEGTGSPNAPGATGITWTSLQNTFLTPAADEALGTFAYDGASSGSATYSLSLPTGFRSDLLAGGMVTLRSFATGGATSYLFNSRSAQTVANRPILSITAVPEPAVATLLGLGVILRRARRRKSRCPFED